MSDFRPLIRNPAAADPAIIDLRQRLDAFYASTSDYDAFSDHAGRPPEYYRVLRPVLDEVLKKPQPKILEVGAGRTRFPEGLGKDRSRVEIHLQDVTAQNEEFLRQVANKVHIGDISSIPDNDYDLVFSTYVFEHVSAPREFLEEVNKRLAPGGWHVIICPRYDVPGYINPSLRHLPSSVTARIAAKLFFSRLGVLLGGRPAFWVNTDPAVFHKPWYTDADAVHLASQFDVIRWHAGNGFRLQRLLLPCSTGRDWIAKRLLTISLAFQKHRGS